MADRDPLLQLGSPQQVRFERTFWISMPQEYKALPRIQAVWRHVVDHMAEQPLRLQPA